MPTCARCGAANAGPPSLNLNGEYAYCDDCNAVFESIKENGVHVRSRHTNREFARLPYVVEVSAEGIDNPHAQTIYSRNKPTNQTEALAMAKQIMEEHDLPGVFVYQKSGSVWMIDEYLDAHPGIARDVENERTSRERSWLSRILGR